MSAPQPIPAHEALLDLAAVTRPDLARRDLHGEILNAGTRGKTWPQILVLVAGVLARGEDVRDLRAAISGTPKTRRTREDDHA